MAKALIIYASMTGNTEKIAHILGKELEKLQVETRVVDVRQVDTEEFYFCDICIVAAYTYGRFGDIPEEMYDFYEELGEMDLSDKVYGVLGSGEEFYGYYCRAVDTFEEQFENTQAVKGAEGLKIELNPEEEDEKAIAEYAAELLKTWEKKQTS